MMNQNQNIMAGAKETPRQKMIGMMYLVLTALLALNVSKEIIEAFVSIDNNVQEANQAVRKKGNYSFDSLKEVTSDTSDPLRAKSAELWFTIAKEIRSATEENILYIDQLKIRLLEECGEDKNEVVKNDQTVPYLLDLSLIKAKDKYDDPMRILIGENTDIKHPTGEGMEVWKRLIQFRNTITELLGTYTLPQSNLSFSFSSSAPGDFSKSNPDDTLLIRQLFNQLSKKEYRKVHDIDNVHWVGATFDHAPIVAAIAQLSSLQTEFLNAEAEALAHIRNKIGNGQYSFNKIMPLAYGKSYINPGDTLNVQVLMAAYDSYKIPRVSYTDPMTREIVNLQDHAYKDGKGLFNLTPQKSGADTLSGTISIQNKNGQWATQSWHLPYYVGSPGGAISQPQMQILYRSYDNLLTGATSGYANYKLVSRSNVTLSKSSDGTYIALPGPGRTAEIAIVGIDENGKSSQLAVYEYQVRRKPTPDLFVGGIKRDQEITKNELLAQNRLFVKYDESIPLTSDFTPVRYELNNPVAPRSLKVEGASITREAQRYLSQLRQGSSIKITCYYKDSHNHIARVSSVLTIK